MMGNVGGFDYLVHFLKVGVIGVEPGDIVEHETLELVFAARGVGVDHRTDSSGVLGPLG